MWEIFCRQIDKALLGKTTEIILRIKRAVAFSCMLIVLVMATGCTSAGGQSAGGNVGSPAQPETSTLGTTIDTKDNMTIYNCGGIQIGIQTEYLNQLIVKTEFASSDEASYETLLLTVNEKASVEAAKADSGEEFMGFLFGIERLTQAGYEQYISSDHSGREAFAKDGDNYYVYITPTDVQFCRSGDRIETESAYWQNWLTLLDMRSTVKADIISRNGLTPYDDEIFWNDEFTYSGEHIYVKYYPYFTFDGSKREYNTLVLSQPVRQGEGGIWCVERFYDVYGNIYVYFLGSDIIGSVDGTAEEYYDRIQTECDAGERNDVLIPLGAAEWFVLNSGYYNDTPTDGSFEETVSRNRAYTTTNKEVMGVIPTLLSGKEVESMKLLSCMGKMTFDNWGVLGRNLYGSDWWSPLRAALEAAAVGTNQDSRDGDMIRLYLSYSKTEGPIAEGLSEILLSQYKVDAEVFDKVLSGFSDAEQASIRGAVESVSN